MLIIIIFDYWELGDEFIMVFCYFYFDVEV